MATKAINLRIPEERLAIIDRAASYRGQNRTDFVLECSYREAIAAMNERPLVQLDDDAHDTFVAALAAPAAPSDRLRDLLSRSAPWD
jgi:uncharacterized protein (DUF1778 family)